METVFETITRLIQEKKDNHVAPVSLTFNEIRKARDKLLREELNSLYLDNKIKKVRLINDTAITL